MSSRVPTTGHCHVFSVRTVIKKDVELSAKEKEYLDMIKQIPLNSILDEGLGEAGCKKIGQDIFDHFKGASDGDSQAGKKAMQNIADALVDGSKAGRDRYEYVIRAWDNTGDNNFRWMH